MTAGSAAIWSAALFALLALAAGVSERHTEYASGLFAVATVMTAIALTVLLNAFGGEHFNVRAVALHSALGLPYGYRLLAAWGSPAGAALGMALATGVAGVIATYRVKAGGTLAAYAAFMCTLLSIAVMRNPLAALAFVPADGLGSSLVLQQPGIIASIAGCLIIAAAAPRMLAVAVAPSTPDCHRGRWSLVTLIASCLTMLTWWYTSVAAGVSRAPSPLAQQRGACALLLVTMAISARILRLPKATSAGSSASWAGMSIAVASVALLLAAPTPYTTQRAVLILAIVAGALAVFTLVSAVRENKADSAREQSALQGPWPTRMFSTPAGVLSVLAISCAVAALFGTVLIKESRPSVGPGQVYSVGGLNITHLGISRFEVGGGQIVAVALDGNGALHQAQRREVVSVRGERLGPLATPPAVINAFPSTITVWLEEILPGDAVQITVRVSPLATLWPLATLLLVAAAVPLLSTTRGEP